MSKVTEELDFMWRERLLDLYESYARSARYETGEQTPNSDAMWVIVAMLKVQGLTVMGIEG